MKKSLTILGSVAVLLVASTDMNNSTNNTLTTKSIKPMIDETATALFNNKYGYLSTGKTANWITSQSQKDGNFYSYDTSHLTNADGSIWYLSDGKTDARNAFKVDSDGQLVANIKISDQDKINLENSKEEMIKDREITTIKDKYNPYSKSEYSTSYFDGGNNDWQYMQLGSLPAHIDISKQPAGSKVEYNNNLSEALGLYYIAKATRNNQIDKSIANNLATYFMGQTSIKNSFNTSLTNIIINLISKNDNIYNFLYYIPVEIKDKNNSINYIFDKDNNLVEIYYNEFNKDSINENISYNYSDSYNGTSSSNRIDGPNIILLSSWKKYACNWESFIKIYPILTFDNSSYIEVRSQYGTGNMMGSQLNINSIDIDKNQLWYVENKHDGGPVGATVVLQAWVLIAHDDNNIYLRWHITEYGFYATEGLHFNICVNNCNLINVMS